MLRKCLLRPKRFDLFASNVLDKVTDKFSDSISNLVQDTRLFQDERNITESRRPVSLQPSSENSLAERVKMQKSCQQHLVPISVKVNKTRQYIEFTWPTDAQTDSHSGEAPVHRTIAMAEYLRVYTPSTDGKYGVPNMVIYGRKGITVKEIIPVGNYALRLVFSDGHTGGIYPFEYLYYLTEPSNKFRLMREYIRELKQRKKSREPPKRAVSKRHSPSSNKTNREEEEYTAPAFPSRS